MAVACGEWLLKKVEVHRTLTKLKQHYSQNSCILDVLRNIFPVPKLWDTPWEELWGVALTPRLKPLGHHSKVEW